MQQLKLLMLLWLSFSGCGREHVAVVVGCKSCQYLTNGCLQPMGTSITQGAKLNIFYDWLTLIVRMRQGACRCSFSQ
jgi:hypothetical protein